MLSKIQGLGKIIKIAEIDPQKVLEKYVDNFDTTFVRLISRIFIENMK